MRTQDIHEQKALAVGVTEASAMLGVCKQTLRAAVAAGELPSFKIGKSIKIPKAALERLLEVA
jgi:excisionase family DNA binding protein